MCDASRAAVPILPPCPVTVPTPHAKEEPGPVDQREPDERSEGDGNLRCDELIKVWYEWGLCETRWLMRGFEGVVAIGNHFLGPHPLPNPVRLASASSIINFVIVQWIDSLWLWVYMLPWCSTGAIEEGQRQRLAALTWAGLILKWPSLNVSGCCISIVRIASHVGFTVHEAKMKLFAPQATLFDVAGQLCQARARARASPNDPLATWLGDTNNCWLPVQLLLVNQHLRKVFRTEN